MNTDLLITLTAGNNDKNNVTIAFVMGAKAAQKGLNVEILLLSNGVYLAENGYGDKIDIGEPFPAIKDILPKYLEAGGKIKVCSACLKHNNVDMNNLIKNAEVVDADYVVDAIMEAKKTLQLN